MNPQILNTLKQIGSGLYRCLIGFPNYVKACLPPLFWLVIAAAALAGVYIALRGIWTVVQIALEALGMKGG